MKGIDISHYQNEAGKVDLKLARAAGYQFAFMKCSEGTGYKDRFYETNKALAREAGMLFGAYHFARGGDPVKEADWFLASVGTLLQGEIVVLDWEIDHSDPASWCLAWLSRVESKLGFKPMLYTNEARAKDLRFKSVVDRNFGLWVAKYASQVIYVPEYLQRKPVSGAWPFWAIWQFSSRAKVPGIVGNCDVNTTDMSIDILKKYGKPQGQVPACSHSCPVHCTP
jgi:GH25 family lysozyme M1 (1,4-beta-N-acetylmuramidase)